MQFCNRPAHGCFWSSSRLSDLPPKDESLSIPGFVTFALMFASSMVTAVQAHRMPTGGAVA